MSRTYEQLEPVISALDERIKTGLSAFPTDTAEGSIASFADGADDIPLKSLVVDINPVQSGSGDPSPDNVRPISGWTGMQLNANGTTIPISWQTEAGTVYGGHLDVLSGVLTVDMAMVDLGTLSWVKTVTNAFYINTGLTPAAKVSLADGMNMICSKYPYGGGAGTGSTGKDKVICYNWNVLGNIIIFDSAYADIATFKTAMSGVQLCYELAEPIEIQLTPHEVKSLYGQNNIFADTGDCSVEYRADTKMYIERLTEPDADMIADANIVSGQYFMVGNHLYLATANIASGSAVIVGTNCTQKSLATALNEINK